MNKKPPLKPPALGRGMAALIPSAVPLEAPVAAPAPDGLKRVPVDEIDPMPGQPRTRIDLKELAELTHSIREKGVLQPLLVRAIAGRYQLIAGERRLTAAKEAGLKTVPVLVKDVNESEAFQLALIENMQREDLNPVDVGKALRKLSDDFKLTQEEIAQRIG